MKFLYKELQTSCMEGNSKLLPKSQILYPPTAYLINKLLFEHKHTFMCIQYYLWLLSGFSGRSDYF